MAETAHSVPALPLLWRYRAQRQCPDCGSHDVARSRRRGLDSVLLVLLRLRPYRCRHCAERFFAYSAAFRVPSHHEESQAA